MSENDTNQQGNSYREPQPADAYDQPQQPSQENKHTDYVPNWQTVSQESQATYEVPARQAGQSQPVTQSQPAAQPQQPATQPQPQQPAASGQSFVGQTAAYTAQQAQAQQAQATNYQQYQARQAQQQTASYQQPQAGSSNYQQYQAQQAPIPPAPKKERKHKIGPNLKTFLAGFAGAALATIIILVGANLIAPTSTISSGASTNTTFNVQGEDTTLAEAVAAKDLPSVVCIYVSSSVSGNWGFTPSSETSQVTSLGSGVILTNDGYILTNYHVIEGGSSFSVSFGSGETCDAKVVGTDETSDLAVLKVDKSGLTPIEIGSSSDLAVGEWVMALGSPYGMEQSVSTGIISALSRSSESLQVDGSSAVYTNMIQTDAAINPGNSGGALVDKNGKLIGINTMIASNSESSAGVGFAIPVDYAYEIAQQIMSGESPSHAQLGVSLVSVNASMAQQYGFSVEYGAYVNSVVAGSGADEAGIQEGDIITKIDGKDMESGSSVIVAVRSHKPGDKITVEVARGNDAKSFEVTLGSDK